MTDEPAGDEAVDEGATTLRTIDGRVPGRRGLATRARLLECTARLLSDRSYRELTVIEIAREAKTSPATFYQYFPDVESAVLVLAEEMHADAGRFSELVRSGRWRGRGGYEQALALADRFFDFWEENRGILRVVDLATAEGDLRFQRIRTRMLNAVTMALAEAIVAQQPDGRRPEHLDPTATAGVLVAMLAQVAQHRYGFEFWGIRTSDLRHSLAQLIYWGVNGQKPPKP